MTSPSALTGPMGGGSPDTPPQDSGYGPSAMIGEGSPSASMEQNPQMQAQQAQQAQQQAILAQTGNQIRQMQQTLNQIASQFPAASKAARDAAVAMQNVFRAIITNPGQPGGAETPSPTILG